jgi:hypothetical protein
MIKAHCQVLKREILKYSHNYQIPWSRVLLEKLKVPQLIKKRPAFYGT